MYIYEILYLLVWLFQSFFFLWPDKVLAGFVNHLIYDDVKLRGLKEVNTLDELAYTGQCLPSTVTCVGMKSSEDLTCQS